MSRMAPGVAVSVAALTACGPVAPDRLNEGKPLSVSVVEVSLSDTVELERRVTGLVEARRTSGLGFELAGELKRVTVEEGDAVAGGDRLAALDTERLEQRRREAAATLAEVEARLELARGTLERTRRARATEAVTEQALDEALREAGALEASRERAAAALAGIEVDLKKSSLKAPFDGKIAARFADEGQVLDAGRPVVELIETARKDIVAGLAEAVADDLKIGERFVFRVEGEAVEAGLFALLPRRGDRTRTVTARFRFADPDDRFRDGALATTEIVRRYADNKGYWLPRSALTDNLRGLWAAYVLRPTDGGKGHTAARVDLEVLHQTDSRVFVRGGLEEGDRVVKDGVHRLTPGTRVAPKP